MRLMLQVVKVLVTKINYEYQYECIKIICAHQLSPGHGILRAKPRQPAEHLRSVDPVCHPIPGRDHLFLYTDFCCDTLDHLPIKKCHQRKDTFDHRPIGFWDQRFPTYLSFGQNSGTCFVLFHHHYCALCFGICFLF